MHHPSLQAAYTGNLSRCTGCLFAFPTGLLPEKSEGSVSGGDHHMGIKAMGHDAEHPCLQHGHINEKEKKQ